MKELPELRALPPPEAFRLDAVSFLVDALLCYVGTVEGSHVTWKSAPYHARACGLRRWLYKEGTLILYRDLEVPLLRGIISAEDKGQLYTQAHMLTPEWLVRARRSRYREEVTMLAKKYGVKES